MSAATIASEHPLRRGPDNVAVGRGPVFARVVAGGAALTIRLECAVTHRLAQPLSFLLLLDSLRDPDRTGTGHEYDVARWNRDVGREARPLCPERILDDLHQHFLPVAYQVGDGRAVAEDRPRLGPGRVRSAVAGGGGVAYLLGVRVSDVRRMEKGCAVEPDIHERGLHAGKNPGHPALVDVSDEPAAVGALDEDFLERAVLDQRDPGLAWSDVDQQLGAHGSGRLAANAILGSVVPQAAGPHAAARSGQGTRLLSV